MWEKGRFPQYKARGYNSLYFLIEKMMTVVEITASTAFQNTVDEYDKIVKQRNEEGTTTQNEGEIE